MHTDDYARGAHADPPPSGEDAPQAARTGVDFTALNHALEELRDSPALALDAAGALARREEAVARLAQEVRLRLAARGSPATLAQGLRRLEDTLYREPELSDPADPPTGALPPGAAGLLDRFDDLYRAQQAAARRLLRDELGLDMMTTRVGQAIDPVRHNVTGSVSGDDPSLDNTVAQVEAPGWLLDDAVLARADVIRYSCSSAGVPMLPPLDDVRSRDLDDTMVGRKVSGGTAANKSREPGGGSGSGEPQ